MNLHVSSVSHHDTENNEARNVTDNQNGENGPADVGKKR